MSETKTEAKTEKRGFEAEVSRLLHMMVHSVYSDREIFLRELISNASDACDKLRYAALTAPALKTGEDFGIAITVDAKAKTITVADNGIGMNHDELIENLGTIARSGTANFVNQLSGDSKKDVQLIGQFGVGFYSVFMVADSVTVTTRKAGDDTAWRWTSAGEGTYEISEAEKATEGTEIILNIKEDAVEFLEQYRLKNIVTTYSDHIAVPITLAIKGGEDKKDAEAKVVNEGSAIWARPKADITDEQYAEFYKHVGHAFDEPAHRLHYKVEGMQEYTVLLFIPTQKPMDLFDPARKNRVKLYVKRVFISDEGTDLMPGWLRFMRGVVDSQDLPLNVSREMLQNNPVVARMSKAITNKILGELETLAEKETEKFEKIWTEFGPVLKEGIYEDFSRKEQLLKLARFKSTGAEGWTSLADYVSRMKDKQSKIYYITGTDEKALRKSPQLEGFKSRGIEVLILPDPVDDFWLQGAPDFEGKPFASVTRGSSDLDEIAETDTTEKKEKAPEGEVTKLITLMKEVLGDKVSDVRASSRLTETASCLVASDTGMDMAMERLLKAHNQLDSVTAKVLEINPSHGLVKALAKKAGDKGALDSLADPVWLVFDQARILEGDALDDPSAFARRLSAAMEKGLV